MLLWMFRHQLVSCWLQIGVDVKGNHHLFVPERFCMVGLWAACLLFEPFKEIVKMSVTTLMEAEESLPRLRETIYFL